MKRSLFAGGMLLLACATLTACTTGGSDEVQYVKIGQNFCSFRAEGNQPLEIEVKASPAAWTVEAGATWVKAERTDSRVLTVTVDDNGTGSERSAVLTVTAGQAVQEITVHQLPQDGTFARFRKVDYFSQNGAMSPSGRYVGGYTVSIAADDSFLKSPTIIDVETGETYQFGPYPEALYYMTQTMCISDQGLLFIVDGNQGGTFVCDLEGNITKLEALEGFRGKPTIQGTSADGKYWVGYASQAPIGEGLTKPLLWTDGVAAELPLPDLNFRDEEIWYGVMARGISANGEIIYGTSWENSDFGMLYWRNEGANTAKPRWVGDDVREVTSVKLIRDGEEYDYNVVNGFTCQAQLTKVSPSGRWIAGTYRTETPADDRQSIVRVETAAFYNTETETSVIVEDYGESSGIHVTDDGIGFVGIGTLGISSGAVYDLNTHTDLGSTQDWIYDNYGIIIPAGYIQRVSADGRFLFGVSAQSSAMGVSFINWYIAPPLGK